jgi:hypothetical protein
LLSLKARKGPNSKGFLMADSLGEVSGVNARRPTKHTNPDGARNHSNRKSAGYYESRTPLRRTGRRWLEGALLGGRQGGLSLCHALG